MTTPPAGSTRITGPGASPDAAPGAAAQPPEHLADPVTAKPPAKAKAKSAEQEEPAIPTGFPDPAAAGPEPADAGDREPPAEGMTRLATVPPMGELHVDDVTITAEGTDVDQETADRARRAALLSGMRLRDL